jgi:DNA-binding transcriptional regulator LsrR (DeoR family)
VTRRVGVAGGKRKYCTIRAAVLGNWINVWATDLLTTRRLLAEPAAMPQ